MITADTITDEQIRELRDLAMTAADDVDDPGTVHLDGSNTIFSGEVLDLCRHALAPYHVSPVRKLNARARCAEILNARGAK